MLLWLAGIDHVLSCGQATWDEAEAPGTNVERRLVVGPMWLTALGQDWPASEFSRRVSSGSPLFSAQRPVAIFLGPDFRPSVRCHVGP